MISQWKRKQIHVKANISETHQELIKKNVGTFAHQIMTRPILKIIKEPEKNPLLAHRTSTTKNKENNKRKKSDQPITGFPTTYKMKNRYPKG